MDTRIRRRRQGRHRTTLLREDGSYDADDVGVFLGLAVGMTAHHGHGHELGRPGRGPRGRGAAYLRGLAMRRSADLYPGEARTDA